MSKRKLFLSALVVGLGLTFGHVIAVKAVKLLPAIVFMVAR